LVYAKGGLTVAAAIAAPLALVLIAVASVRWIRSRADHE
jgi:hypothetical protein